MMQRSDTWRYPQSSNNGMMMISQQQQPPQQQYPLTSYQPTAPFQFGMMRR